MFVITIYRMYLRCFKNLLTYRLRSGKSLVDRTVTNLMETNNLCKNARKKAIYLHWVYRSAQLNDGACCQ